MPVTIQELLVRVNIANKKEPSLNTNSSRSLNNYASKSNALDLKKILLDRIYTEFDDKKER